MSFIRDHLAITPRNPGRHGSRCHPGRTTTLVVSLTLGLIQLAFGQSPGQKVGLVLSGGGAKGISHVGALKVIEAAGITIDFVAGTSMGCLVGSMISTGYDTPTIERLAYDTPWYELFSDARDRNVKFMQERLRDGRTAASLVLRGRGLKLPTGLVSGQRAVELLASLTQPIHHIREFKDLPIPLVCVATDLETGEAVQLTKGYLPEAVRASLSIPTVFTPQPFDERLLIDGGIARNLPAEDVIGMGATEIICIDVTGPSLVGDELSDVTAVLRNIVGFHDTTPQQREKCDVLIRPETFDDDALDFDNIEYLIDAGEAAAQKEWSALRKIGRVAEGLGSRRNVRPAIVDSIYVFDVTVEGVSDRTASFIKRQARIATPGWLALSDLRTTTNRIYSTGLFERLTYELEPDPKGTRLLFRARRHDGSRLDLGFRYDSKTNASLLLSTTLRSMLFGGSAMAIDFKAGERTSLQTDLNLGLGVIPGMSVKVSGLFEQRDFSTAARPVRAQARYRRALAEMTLGTYLSRRALVSGGYRLEDNNTIPKIGQTGDRNRRQLGLIVGRFWVDSYKRSHFPTRGRSLYVEAHTMLRTNNTGDAFSQVTAIADFALPLFSRVSILGTAQIVSSSGENIPESYRPTLGGLYRQPREVGEFVGLFQRELDGRHLRMADARLQIEFQQDRFLILRANIGDASESWTWELDPQPMIKGWGTTLGLLTNFGPVEFTLANSSLHDLVADLSFGFRF